MLSLDDRETVDSCANGCQPTVVVGLPGVVAWPGGGFRLEDHVVRNVRDVIVQTEEMAAAMLIPGSNAALMKERPVD
jgi:hypothetical protein